MVPRGCMYHYPGRNVADANMAGVVCGMLLVPYDMAGVGGMLPGDVVAAIQQTMVITSLVFWIHLYRGRERDRYIERERLLLSVLIQVLD
ncbi:hypothetical protein L1987_44303 [Smallanthus sonchifolius]|uniref:Uncharacterized protein n=1 Tax=Smallanthus sonchifolius TaxID=185202 RepID=A0ACB9GNY4_9ASTR|nr:hypothetical protein L1987_44303 [Smallanthus sonchifolius]